MDWSDIRIFLAIAREGTLGAASRRLQLSHPTVGRRLRALEQATGQVLFQRTADGFVLTEEGLAVLPLAEQMEESAVTMQRQLAGHPGKLDGTLRISSADWFGSYVLPPLVAEYAGAYPCVDIEILTGTRLFNLAQREADLAFRIVPFEGPDIVQKRLLWMQYAVYESANTRDPIDRGNIRSRLITMDSSTGAFADAQWLRERLPEAQVVLQSNNRNVQAQMCARGLGIAVLPRAIGDQLSSLRCLSLGEDPPSREIWMGYHRDLRRQQRLRAFVDIAVKHLSAASLGC